MKKRKPDKKLLHEAIRLMMEEEWREANEEIKDIPLRSALSFTKR